MEKQAYEPTEIQMWTTRDNYIGEDCSDYYVAYTYSKNQGSLMNKANWHTFIDELDKYLTDDDCDVETAHFSHWVSDFEALLIHKSEYEALRVADELRKEIKSYPILDEDYFYELQYNQRIENIEWLADCDTERAENIHGWLCTHHPEALDDIDGWVVEEYIEKAVESV